MDDELRARERDAQLGADPASRLALERARDRAGAPQTLTLPFHASALRLTTRLERFAEPGLWLANASDRAWPPNIGYQGCGALWPGRPRILPSTGLVIEPLGSPRAAIALAQEGRIPGLRLRFESPKRLRALEGAPITALALKLGGNIRGAEVARLLRALPALRRLRLEGPSEALAGAAEALRERPLELLWLPKAPWALGEVLPSPGLRALRVDRVGWDLREAREPPGSTLESLDLDDILDALPRPWLRRLPRLRDLGLHVGFTPADAIRAEGHLPSLQILDLPVGAPFIAVYGGLRALRLGPAAFDLSVLRACHELRRLAVNVPEEGLPGIAALEQLDELSLFGAQALDGLAELPGSLRALELATPPRGSTSALTELGRLARLEHLALAGVSLGEAAAAALARLPRLRGLTLGAPETPTPVLEALASSASLERVSLHSAAEPEALEALRQARPELEWRCAAVWRASSVARERRSREAREADAARVVEAAEAGLASTAQALRRLSQLQVTRWG